LALTDSISSQFQNDFSILEFFDAAIAFSLTR